MHVCVSIQDALFDPEADIKDEFDNTTHTATYHNRLRTAPKLKHRARRLDTIQEEDEELDTADELLATQTQPERA